MFLGRRRIMLSHFNLCPCRVRTPLSFSIIKSHFSWPSFPSVLSCNGSWGMSRYLAVCNLICSKMINWISPTRSWFWMCHDTGQLFVYGVLDLNFSISGWTLRKKQVHLFRTEIKNANIFGPLITLNFSVNFPFQKSNIQRWLIAPRSGTKYKFLCNCSRPTLRAIFPPKSHTYFLINWSNDSLTVIATLFFSIRY